MNNRYSLWVSFMLYGSCFAELPPASIESVLSIADVTSQVIYGTWSLMGELEELVEIIETNVDDLLIGLEEHNTNLLSVSDALCIKIMDLDADVVNVQSAVDGIDATVNNIQSTTNTIDTNVSQLIGDLSSHDSDLLSVSDALCIKIMDLDADVVNVQSTVDGIDVTVNNIQTTTNTIDTNVSQLVTDLSSHDGDLLSVSDELCTKIMNLDADVANVQSAVDGIDVTVNSIQSVANTIDTNVSQLIGDLSNHDGDLLSVSDVLCTKIMDLADTTAISFAGDDVQTQRVDHITVQFNNGISTKNVSTSTSGAGTVSETSGLAFVSTNGGTTDAATATSTHVVPCKSGHEAYGMFSAVFPDGGVANTTQWVGLFDDLDGLAVGFDGVDFGILYRNNSVDTVVAQASFNGDTLDGLGASGFTLDTTKLNVFRITYAWYGVALMRFEVLGADGAWIVFHEITQVNTQAGTSFSTSYLPLRAQAINNSTAASVGIGTSAWRAGVLQPCCGSSGTRIFSVERSETTLSTGAQYLFTIRNKTTYNGVPNKIKLRIVGFGGGNETDTTPTTLRYYKNATINGTPAFTDVNASDSVAEIDVAGTGITGGDLTWVYGANGVGFEYLTKGSPEFILLPGETLTITATKLLSLVSLTLYASITWEEYH